jgi:hypothetical protein
MSNFPSQNLDKIVIRVPDGLRDRIARAAKDNGRSVNAELVRLLESHYPAPPSLKEIEDELDLLAFTIKNSSGRYEKFEMDPIANMIQRLREKIASLTFQKGEAETPE